MGAKIVQILDDAGLTIKVALWLYTSEYEDWRFVLSSGRLDSAKPSDAYGLIHDALEHGGLALEQTPTLMILRMADPFVRALRLSFGKTKSVEGMRLGGQMIGDRFVEDAIVYRVV